jgi:hypothetical protein
VEGARPARGRRGGRIEGGAGLRLAFGVVLVALAAGIVADQLFVSPIVGLADNGDFGKIMEPAGLAYTTEDPHERYWYWALVKFHIVPHGPLPGEYKSSETPLVIAAVAASRVLRPGRDFDIRILGALHAGLFLAALALLAYATRALSSPVRAAALVAAVFAFTDVGYVAFFNSLYSQTASWLFLLVTVSVAGVAVARGRLEGPWLAAYFLAAAGFVGSKPQECFHGPLLAVLGVVLARVPRRAWWREPAAWLAAGLVAFSLLYYAAVPRRPIRDVGLYHSVFMELLPDSPDPRGDLRELGLDPGLARYAGMNAYQKEAPLGQPEIRRLFLERFGYGGLLRFYLRHPARLLDRLERAGRRAFVLRTRMGNFDRSAGFPPGARSGRFAAWSSLRERLGGASGPWMILLILGGNLVASAFLVRRGATQLLGWTVAVLVAMAALEFLVCALGDYLGDVSRHLYVFQGLVDLLLVFDLAAIVAAAAGEFRRAEPVAPEAEAG